MALPKVEALGRLERLDRELLCARAPHESVLREWFEHDGMPKVMGTRANALSAVLEVEFGRTRIVLGGDLPVCDSCGKVPTGWDRVLASHAHLIEHTGFKVPHHGSREALHEKMIQRSGRDRAWLLTPFNSSSLPRLDEDDGLDLLLEGQSPVMLTARSLSKKLLCAHDNGRVTPADLRTLRKAGATPCFGSSDTVFRADDNQRVEALDALWCVAFDRQRPVGRWRGRAALEVHAAEA